jgi:hypothetical protein
MKRSSILTALLLVYLAAPVWSAEIKQFRGQGPSRVFMQTLTGDTCANVDADGETAMARTLTLSERSHLLISFTFEWGGLDTDEEGLVSFTVDGGSTDSSAEWGFAGTTITRTSGNLTWAFANVPVGTHTVAAGARVEGGNLSAELNDCGFTVMVIERRD